MKKLFVIVIIPMAMISWITFLGNHLNSTIYDEYYMEEKYFGDRAFQEILSELYYDYQVIDGDNYDSEDMEVFYAYIITEKKMYHYWSKILFGGNIISPWELDYLIDQFSTSGFFIDEDVNEIIKI
jgi:hypothetical protein